MWEVRVWGVPARAAGGICFSRGRQPAVSCGKKPSRRVWNLLTETHPNKSRTRRIACPALLLLRHAPCPYSDLSLIHISNFLKSGVVQQWFRRDPRVQATELLLQERPVAHVAAAPKKKRRAKSANR